MCQHWDRIRRPRASGRRDPQFICQILSSPGGSWERPSLARGSSDHPTCWASFFFFPFSFTDVNLHPEPAPDPDVSVAVCLGSSDFDFFQLFDFPPPNCSQTHRSPFLAFDPVPFLDEGTSTRLHARWLNCSPPKYRNTDWALIAATHTCRQAGRSELQISLSTHYVHTYLTNHYQTSYPNSFIYSAFFPPPCTRTVYHQLPFLRTTYYYNLQITDYRLQTT